MELVIDANIIFAAFIKDSTTRRILLTRTPVPLRLYTTPYILDEIYKYRKLLAEKTGLKEEVVAELALELLSASGIEIVKEEELSGFKNEAEQVSPRLNDAPYFAVALCKACGIWSNDKPIRKQGRVKILSTMDLLKVL